MRLFCNCSTSLSNPNQMIPFLPCLLLLPLIGHVRLQRTISHSPAMLPALTNSSLVSSAERYFRFFSFYFWIAAVLGIIVYLFLIKPLATERELHRCPYIQVLRI